jgi:hypothetical protein
MTVKCTVSPLQSPDEVVEAIVSIEGNTDLYCWYEGMQGLPKLGASFMKEEILQPIFSRKKNLKVGLYSLKSWNFKREKQGSAIGEIINKMNRTYVECVYSASFFKYCQEASKKREFYAWIQEELPKKGWLFDLSQDQEKEGLAIADLFKGESSLFDCINELDVSRAYSLMQYIEGYYLIQESIRKRMLSGERAVQIFFALPNDESKYYKDLPVDLERMLQADFGGELIGCAIDVQFLFFQYGDSLKARPYIGKDLVKPKNVGAYFNYLDGWCSK